jgi:four helix bundle protein
VGKRFEELSVWRKARALTKIVYELTNSKGFVRDLPLRDQMRRASVSTMSNVAEGYERSSDRELARFLAIARGSCGELRSQLYVARDQGYLETAAFRRTHDLAVELSRMLRGFEEAVRAQRHPSPSSPLA